MAFWNLVDVMRSHINVRSKAGGQASLVYRTTQNKKRKKNN